jgi:hypothetical protein
MEREYHYYIFPEISSWRHQSSKICHQYNSRVIPDPALDLDALYESGQLCPKCAFYAGLWYDVGKVSSIREHIKRKIRAPHPKSPDSPYWIDAIDLSEENGDPSSTIIQLSPKKIENEYYRLVKKNVYKEADFAALGQTLSILEELQKRIAKYPDGLSIFQETVF